MSLTSRYARARFALEDDILLNSKHGQAGRKFMGRKTDSKTSLVKYFGNLFRNMEHNRYKQAFPHP